MICIRVIIGAFGTSNYAFYSSLTGLLPWFFLLDFGIGLLYGQSIVRCAGDDDRILRIQALYDSLLLRVAFVSVAVALCFGLFVYELWKPWHGIPNGDLALGLLIVSVLGCWSGLLNARARMTICMGNAQILQGVVASSWLVIALVLSCVVYAVPGKANILAAIFVVMLGQALGVFYATGRWRTDSSVHFGEARRWAAKNAHALWVSLGYSLLTVCYLQIDSIIIPKACAADQIAKYNLIMKLGLGWHVFYFQLLQYTQGDIAARNKDGIAHVTMNEALKVIAYGIAASLVATFGLGIVWGHLAPLLKVNGVIDYGIRDASALLVFLSARCALDYLNILMQTVGDLGFARKVAFCQAIVTAPVIAICARGGASLAIAGLGAALWIAGVVPLFYMARKCGALRPSPK
jgi:hypothetical protein